MDAKKTSDYALPDLPLKQEFLADQPIDTKRELKIGNANKCEIRYADTDYLAAKTFVEPKFESITQDQAEAMAARIVKCCNGEWKIDAHDDLVEALNNVCLYAESYRQWLNHYGGNHMTEQKQSYNRLVEQVEKANGILGPIKQKHT